MDIPVLHNRHCPIAGGVGTLKVHEHAALHEAAPNLAADERDHPRIVKMPYRENRIRRPGVPKGHGGQGFGIEPGI